MNTPITTEFLESIPKTDLHVHLDGSLRIPTLIELAREKKVELPSYEEAGLKELVFKDFYKDLPEYLAGFAYTVAVMQDEESLERIAYEMAQDNIAEGVRYMEVRYAPQLHMRQDFPMKPVVASVARGLEKAKKEHNNSAAVKSGDDIPFECGIIVCALRFIVPQMSPYYRDLFSVMPYARQKDVFAAASLELARAADILAHEEGLPVVGFDLAGAEKGFPAGDHKEAFMYAHSHFIKKTVHAGEAYGPESIFQAITDCHANRIGHGTHLFDVNKIESPKITDREAYVTHLSEYIASERIHIEVNLTSNLQTLPEMKSVAEHPLKQMIEKNLSASICTDNRLVSSTTVTRELSLAVEELNLGPREVKNLVIAGFKGSFFPGSYTEKRAYVRQVLDRYDKLEKELLS